MNEVLHIKLLSETAQGDRSAFEQLYQQTSGKLYAVSLQLLQNKEAAEEALQEAFVRIWHNASEYSSERGTVLSWMMSIVRYRALDMLRAAKTRREKTPEAEENDEDHSPELNLFQQRSRVQLDNCMDTLDKPQADAITLAYFRGFTHSELCLHMESPLGSVKSWIRRGLQRLRSCMES